MENLESKICWYESITTFAQSMNLSIPLTKRNIIVACTLEVTVNFSRSVIALNRSLSKDAFKLFTSSGCEASSQTDLIIKHLYFSVSLLL